MSEATAIREGRRETVQQGSRLVSHPRREGQALLLEAGAMTCEEVAYLVDRNRGVGLDLVVRGERASRVARLVGGPLVDGEPVLLIRAEGSGAVLAERARRGLDLVIGGALLVLLAPLMGLIALAVKCGSRGPVFHRAEVVGLAGRRFTWRKFRTMRAGAGQSPHREAARRFITGADDDFRRDGVFKLRSDDRITRIGRLLRRHSLDELPQLLDVAAGRMSLVGPRPCLPYEWDLYQPHHRRRLDVTPGMTGMWQVFGRSRVDFEEMVLIDRLWGWDRSPGLYLTLLARTAAVVLRGEGGY